VRSSAVRPERLSFTHGTEGVGIWKRHRRLPEWVSRLLGPGQPELSCDECFAALDRYVELEAAGADAEAQFPGMGAHLQGCRACSEEHDLLLDFVRHEEGERDV
jgi:hypothetical protein